MNRQFFAGALVFLAALRLVAQTPITLEDAIRIAVKQNKSVAIARLGLNKAEAQVTEALGNALPSVDVSAGYNRNIQAPVFFIPDFQNPSAGVTPIRVALNNTYSVSAQVSQVLFNSAVFTGIGTSKIYTRVSQEQFNATVAEVIAETKKAFYSALLAKEFENISSVSLANAQELLRNIQALFNEGLVAEYDLIRAQVLVENIKPRVTESKSGYAVAVSALQAYIGSDMGAELLPQGAIIADAIVAPSEREALEQAMTQNRDLRALRSQLEVLNDFVTINQSNYYPTLAAFGQWQNQGQSDSFSGFLSASSTIVGLNFSMNLFNGLKTQAKVQQSQVDVLQLQQQIAQVEDGIKLQVRSLLTRLESAQQRVTAQQTTIRQAQRGYEISQVRYREGAGSLLEINDSDVALATSKVNAVQAAYDVLVTKADLDRTTGVLADEYIQLAR
jgi:outer membrane protein